MRIPRFLAVDFYCGAGGTTRGLLDAGGYVICGIDNDPNCHATYESNNQNAQLDGVGPMFVKHDMFEVANAHLAGQQRPIFDHLGKLIRHYQSQAPDAPLLFAICAPCQSFTKFKQTAMTPARRLARDRDESLLSQAIPFIKEFQPELILSENVVQIRRGRSAHVWQEFKEEIAALGYQVGDGDVCASKFGVPQFRRRSVLLGVHIKDEAKRGMALPIPSSDARSPQISARDAIDHFPPLEAGEAHETLANHVCRNLSPMNKRRLCALKPGEPNFKLEQMRSGEDLSLACHKRLEGTGKRGFGDVYTRMRPDRPSPTITTRFISASNGRFGHYDPDQIRALSIREGAALQSFPDSYEFMGGSTERDAKMVGNAVPPRLAAYLAGWLVDRWAS